MVKLNKLKSVLIGEGSLLIRCAEILLQRQWSLAAIVSNSAEVLAWAKPQGLAVICPQRSADIAIALQDLEFDYLFSIVNGFLLSEEVIGLARQRAINYHDSPLPRYAGLNAATWALIQGETHHAISWHDLTAGIDEGDVLVQVPLAIAADETGLSLNVKCYEAAIAGFQQLSQQLEQDQVQPQPQDLSQRTYFPGWARPWAAGFLDFHQPALQLSRLVRALAFKPGYRTPLAMPKLWLGDNWVAVGKLTILNRSRPEPPLPPGQIVALDGQRLVVSTATANVALSDLRTATTQPLSPLALGYQAGRSLPALPEPASLGPLSETVARHETFWRRRLQRCTGLTLDWLVKDQVTDQPQLCAQTWDGLDALAPRLIDQVRQWQAKTSGGEAALEPALAAPEHPLALALTALLGGFFSRLDRQEGQTLSFSGPVQRALAGTKTAMLFAAFVPMELRCDPDAPLGAALGNWPRNKPSSTSAAAMRGICKCGRGACRMQACPWPSPG
ncbi:MAG: hypothetical protein HC824_20590 [Synechococcales cyanobacterium RM1_1_8]|nr:hypothetical protein [Synechococcales cyanobacterium RM1_1_8]